MTKNFPILTLALLALIQRPLCAKEFKARVLRSQKITERIKGLSVVKEELEVLVEEGLPPKYFTSLLLDFDAKGRSLIADEVYFSVNPKAPGKQQLAIKVPLNKKVVILWFLASGEKLKNEQEKIIISFDAWKDTEPKSPPTPLPVKKPPPSRPLREELDNFEHSTNSLIVGLGISASSRFVVPIIQLEFLLTPKLSLGISPSFFYGADGSASLYGCATHLMLRYYFKSPSSGPWMQLGPGVYAFLTKDTGVTNSAASPAGAINGGWQFDLMKEWALGISAGIQYVKNPNLNSAEIDLSGLHGTGGLSLNHSF